MKQKVATVADLRNHFRRVSAWLENGETVDIIKRGRSFARLVPAPPVRKAVKVDFARQLRAVWGSKTFSESEVQALRETELDSRS